MAKKWSERPYCSGDIDGIFGLFANENSKAGFRTEDWWNWRHRDNPAGDAITWVAEADGKVVSHLSSTPLRAQIMGKEGIILRGGDGRTRPEYRKMGIFSKLMMNTIHQGTKNGWSLFLSLPSEQLYPTLLKLGWMDLKKIPKFVKILQPGIVASIKRKERGLVAGLFCLLLGAPLLKRSLYKSLSGISKKYEISEDNEFDIYYDNFWTKISQNLKIAVIRDALYLNWRYRDNPLYKNSPNHDRKVFSVRRDNEILGFTVLGCYKEKYHVGRIMEFLVEPGNLDVAEILIQKATHFFYERKMDIIMTLAQNSFLEKKIFKKYGYFIDNSGKTNFAIKTMAPPVASSALTNHTDWLVTWGESGIL